MALKTDREKTAHLLRRFGLGASEAELDYYLQDGFNGAIDRLLDYESTDEGYPFRIEQLTDQNKNLQNQVVTAWWTGRMIATRRPLQEKMTLFWHDHFATSAQKVRPPILMWQQNETLRRHATGNFRELLHAASADPAMIQWLDNQLNVKGKANENFAREVMELFTLGIGNYTEKDVLEAARAFTGWGYRAGKPLTEDNPRLRPAEFVVRGSQHDTGPKTVLGKTGNLTGEDVLDHLCSLPRTSEYIATKILEWFVYPNPEKAYVARMSKVFRDSNLDVESLLRAIMKSSEFYSEKAERNVVKNPVDFCVATIRQLGIGKMILDRAAEGTVQPRQYLAPAFGANIVMKNMGMHLMYPPDVAGWEGGKSWISSATMLERIAWADRVFGVSRTANVGQRYPAATLLGDVQSPTQVVDRLASIFDAPLKADRRSVIVQGATKAMGTGITPRNANQVAASVTRLIFATPEFQFS